MHLPTQSSMEPCGIPPIVAELRPNMRAHHIGPPLGVSDEECGTVEALTGVVQGYPAYCDYWKPDAEQLAMLNAGGVIEFIQYTNQMVMHSVSVWKGDGEDPLAKVQEWIDTQEALQKGRGPTTDKLRELIGYE